MKKLLTIFFLSTAWGFAFSQGAVRYDIEPGIVRIQEDYVNNWRKVGEINGYRIQIAAYSGVNSKSQAEYARNSFNNLFPYTRAYLIYNEPYFKVRVGNYRSRLQAHKDLETIKLTYPSAYIVPDKISYR
ncbi:MAG: SPOR domain-containing protein [Bacteroidales bacterium]|nr:SPOR domain-containing protein [Bacteroidales bacterium]